MHMLLHTTETKTAPTATTTFATTTTAEPTAIKTNSTLGDTLYRKYIKKIISLNFLTHSIQPRG